MNDSEIFDQVFPSNSECAHDCFDRKELNKQIAEGQKGFANSLLDKMFSDLGLRFNPSLDKIKGARAKPSPTDTSNLKFFNS